MTVLKKTLLIIGVMYLCVIVVVFFITRNVILEDFAGLEDDATYDNTQRALNIVNLNLDHLEQTTSDWSGWDDTYEFIDDVNDEYIESNLINDTFLTLEINLMMFIRPSGEIAYDKAVDLQEEEEIDISESLYESISTGDILFNETSDPDSSISGVILLPENPLLVASLPILHSDDSGPVRGTLIMGRYLDETLLQDIAEQASLSLTKGQLDDSNMPSDFQKAGLSLSEDAPIYVDSLDEESIAGYALLPDISGDSGLILRVDMPRDIYNQGQSVANDLMLLLLSLGVACVLGVVFMLQKTVLSPIARLSGHVNRISAGGDPSARVSATGNDEISILGGDINDMLVSLQESQEKLRISEERFRALIENSFDVIMIVGPDEAILYVSPSLKKVLGYEPEEWVGRKSYDFIHPDDSQKIANAAAEGIQIQQFARILELRIRNKGGSWRNVETVGINLLHHPAIQGIVINFHDVTERKRAEEALRESEEKYRNLVERANDGVCIIQDGLVKYTNSRLAEMWGGNIEEIIDTPFVNYVDPDDLPLVIERYNQRMAGEQVPSVYETCLRHKDGSRVYTELSIGIIEYSGKPSELVIVRDITERKQAEEKLNELYNEEMQLRQQLETEIRRRADFTRTLVHELKTPLTPVLTSSDMLITELKQEPFLSLAKNINRGALRLNDRIDELLDLAKSEIGILDLHITKVEISQLLRDIIDEMSPEASRRGHTLKLDLPSSLPPARADETRVRQIVLNLLNNACKFTPDGGNITVKAKESNGFLIIEVQDTGPGIAEEDQQKIFQPYYRGESDRQRLSGLGLGLALCKTLVELHGGQIWIQSCIGQGSTFGFSLPLEAPDSRQ